MCTCTVYTWRLGKWEVFALCVCVRTVYVCVCVCVCVCHCVGVGVYFCLSILGGLVLSGDPTYFGNLLSVV